MDVRTREEFQAGHAEGAVNIPLGPLAAASAELSDGTLVVNLCQSGARSGRAVALLHGRGLQVADVHGGLDARVKQSLPVRRP